MWESISNFALVTREFGDRCQMFGNGGYTLNSKLFLRYNTVVNPFPVIERTTDQKGKTPINEKISSLMQGFPISCII